MVDGATKSKFMPTSTSSSSMASNSEVKTDVDTDVVQYLACCATLLPRFAMLKCDCD